MPEEHDDLERLRGLLDDSDPAVRGLTAVALARVDSPAAVEMLMDLLDDSDPHVVCAAIQSLGERKETKAVPALIDMLNRSSEVNIKCSILSAFASIRDPQAFSSTVVQLFDAEDEVRRNAAAALGCLGDTRALEPLYEMLEDNYMWVRANAALSIGSLGEKASVDHLLDLLAAETDDTVRANTLIALGQCDPSRVSLIIERLLDDEEQEKVRVSACIALSEMSERGTLDDEDAAVTALIEVLSSGIASDEVRATCAWTLGRMYSTPTITEALIASLRDEYRWVVFYALESLAILHDTSALPALRAFREERDAAAVDFNDPMIGHIDDAIAELEAVEGGTEPSEE